MEGLGDVYEGIVVVFVYTPLKMFLYVETRHPRWNAGLCRKKRAVTNVIVKRKCAVWAPFFNWVPGCRKPHHMRCNGYIGCAFNR